MLERPLGPGMDIGPVQPGTEIGWGSLWAWVPTHLTIRIHRLSCDGRMCHVIDHACMSDRLLPLNELAAQSILKRSGVSVWANEDQHPGVALAQV